jgi:DivIVA domain-containing protein
MSSTELDLPLLPSSDQIRRREFATIRRGYDPDQVREYLGHIAAQVGILEAELREARLAAGTGGELVEVREPPAEDPYERFAGQVSDVLRAADDHARRVVEEARKESMRVLSEARAEADRIRVDAQAHAEEARQEGSELLEDARRESERVLSSLSARRETLVDQLAQMQSHLLGVARDLEAAIDEPVDDPDELAIEEGPVDGSALPAVEPAGADADDPIASEDAATASEGDAEDDAFEEEPLDPRYEDLWVARETIELDLGDLDLGEERPPAD